MEELLIPLAGGDRIISYTAQSWSKYEAVLQQKPKHIAVRISYLDGVITIMSPGLNHERFKEIIATFIVAYCDRFGLDYYPWGSTTKNI